MEQQKCSSCRHCIKDNDEMYCLYEFEQYINNKKEKLLPVCNISNHCPKYEEK